MIRQQTVVTLLLLCILGVVVAWAAWYSPKDKPTSSATAKLEDCMKFVRDVTIEDTPDKWQTLAAGSSQDKVWEVTNCGTTTWTGDYKLVRVYGESAATDGSKPDLKQISDASVSVPALKPGGKGNITIPLKVPVKPGEYKLFYQISTDADIAAKMSPGECINVRCAHRFGDILWAFFSVK